MAIHGSQTGQPRARCTAVRLILGGPGGENGPARPMVNRAEPGRPAALGSGGGCWGGYLGRASTPVRTSKDHWATHATGTGPQCPSPSRILLVFFPCGAAAPQDSSVFRVFILPFSFGEQQR